VTEFYHRPGDSTAVTVRWNPEYEEAAAEAVAAVLGDVPDADAALDGAPHDVSREAAERIREEYAALVDGGGS